MVQMEDVKSQDVALNYIKVATNTQNAEIMDITKIASTFPQLEKPSIRRENIIITLADMLCSDSEVVIVDGPDGMGKTTLLAQFAREYPNNTFSLFVRSCSRYAYDPGMLLSDLCDQIGWVLKKEGYRTEQDADPAQLLNARLYDLQRQANHERSTYYFIVDGLEEIPEEDSHERDMILNLLPFGIPRFRFILSGTLECLKHRSQKIHGIIPFRLVGFTFEETREFFNGLLEDRSALETIHKICKTIPGNLASVQRLLKAGTSIEQLLDELREHPPAWFELEWRVVKSDDHLLRQVLAILAFDRRCHSLASLARLCKIEIAVLNEKLVQCNFVERRDNGERVEFVCEEFRRFVADCLSAMRREILDTIITDLLNTPDSDDALTHLPGFLNQAGRYEELLNYLSPQHIGNLIDCGDSWIPLHQKADLGVATAMHLARDGDLLRFGLQRATIASIESSESWRSEIEAYVALDDFPAAYALVQQMVTKEDRLQLLAVVAKAKKIKSLPIEIELSDQIQQLYRMIDRGSLGDRGVEIASDLLYTHPELAVELVQECTGKGGAEDRLDLALARLSFRAMVGKRDDIDGMESTQKALRAKVKDPKIQKFINTLSIFYGGYSAEGIVADVDKWEKAADRIYALRAWAVTNAKRQDAAIVVEYAINTILKTATFTANAKVYKELALPLVYIPDLKQVETIIGRFDGLKGPIESAGPTVEYVKLQGTLAEAEARYNRDAASDRLLDLYIYVDDLTDLSAKLVAFAVLSRMLKLIDENKQFEANIGIHSAVLKGLKTVIDEILTSTADHYKAIRPAIGALARSDKKIALGIIDRLNTIDQREAAFVRFMESVSADAPSEENFAALVEAYGKLKTLPMRAKATRSIIGNLLGQKKDMTTFIAKVIALCQWVDDIPDAEEKCQTICMYYEMLHNNAVSKSLLDSLLKKLIEVWNKVDSGWTKIDVGFKIVSVMAKEFPDISRDFLAKTVKAREEIILDSNDMAMSYISCVQLAIRCFGGLMKRKLYVESDFDLLQRLIANIPSAAVRTIAWSDVALKLFMANDMVRCQKIISEWVRPIIDADVIGDEEIRWQVIVSVAPALYSAHKGSALRLIDSLPMPYRDEAYGDICLFLIKKQLPSEPYDSAGKNIFKVDHNTFLDVYEVLQRLEADHAVYWYLELLVDNINKNLRSEFTKPQIADILQKLQGIIDAKFPAPNYINHEGYKILAEAQLARLERGKSPWDVLSARARLIPNVADIAFVLIGIGAAMSEKELTKATSLFKEAKALIPKISTFEDRYDRYVGLAKMCVDVDKQLSKDCLRQAWAETLPMDYAELPKSRRRIIDFAHRLDPEFAASLASETDDDPGREFARSQTKKRLELMKLRERAALGENEAFKITQDNEHYVEFASMMLAGLNTNRINPVHFDLMRQHIKAASRMKLKDAYPVLSWVIENAVRRYSDTIDQVNLCLRPLFEASCLSAELAFRIAARIRSITDSGISAARLTEANGTNMIHYGEREKALNIFKEFVAKATNFIKITDPYFGLEDLELIKLIRSVNLTIPIFILTSRKHQQDSRVQQPWDDSYRSYWRINVSDSSSGEVTIVMLGNDKTGAHPIHDRWWLTENHGLRIGTSVKALGLSRISEVSPITETDLPLFAAEVNRYISGNAIKKDVLISSFRL
jgi:hypothetical protein